MTGFIPEDIINRVRDSVDIVSLVSRYFPLKKTGANYKALCPFHKEKTPSFIVSPSRQSFHCFGCGKGGNVFHFLMAMDRVSFPEAVRQLAREAGIEIPETRRRPDDGPGRDERPPLYDANRRAAEFFARMLASSSGKEAQEYLRSRGITPEMTERCQLGYAPNSWDALLSAAGAAGVPAAVLCRAGLAVRREDGSGCYDRFRNRLMFPIFDTQDRVVGFGARALGPSEVKYINTPETPIFSKGRNLYGLNWARKPLVDNRRVTVVEGYTDVIMAHQHGVENVVATLGTALTRDHIRLLRRYADRIDVVFDADPAGQQAAERSMEVFLAEGAGELVAAGFDVRIATLEAGLDPCDLIARDGPDAFRRTVDAAVDVFTKKIELASRRHEPQDVEATTRAIDEVLQLIAAIPNAVGRELRTDAALRLIADAFRVDDAPLRARLAQLERRRRGRTRPSDDAPSRPPDLDPAEKGLLEAILLAPDLHEDLFAQLGPADFRNEALRQLFSTAKTLYDQDGTVRPARLLDAVSDPDLAAIAAGILHGPERPGLEETARGCLRTLLKRRTQGRLREIRREIEQAKASGDESRADALSIEYLDLQRQLQREVSIL